MDKYNGRRRLLAVEQIFERHCKCSMNEIIELLKTEYGIAGERTAIYKDISVLSEFLPIFKEGNGYNTTYILDYRKGNHPSGKFEF